MKLPKTYELVRAPGDGEWQLKRDSSIWACLAWFHRRFELPYDADRLWVTVYDRPGKNRLAARVTAAADEGCRYLEVIDTRGSETRLAEIDYVPAWARNASSKTVHIGVEYAYAEGT